MRHGRSGWIGRSIALSGLALTLAAAPAAPPAKPEPIAGIRAFLFNSATGGWSPEVIAKNVPLGLNVFTDYHSTSTFVIVDVRSGPEELLGQDAKLRLVAIRGSNPAKFVKTAPRTLLDSTRPVHALSDKPVTRVGFWLPDTGCYTIRLTATLIANGRTSSRKAELDFACEE